MKKQIVKDFKKAEKKIATLKAKSKTPLYFELAPYLKKLEGWEIETSKNSVIFTNNKKGMVMIRRSKKGLEVATPILENEKGKIVVAKLSNVLRKQIEKLVK